MAYVQIPPDSTGKRIPHDRQIVLSYINKINPILVGETLTLPSGLYGTVIFEDVDNSHIHIKLEHDSVDTATVGEDILVAGVIVADVNSIEQAEYIPKVIIVGSNPENQQNIDNKGASSVRFTEGSPRFDSFGRMQISMATTIGDYVFNYDGRDGHFTDSSILGGTVTHDQLVGCMVLSNPTTSGAISRRRTDIHHKYIPGQSQLLEITVACGDGGKVDLYRRWGLFTDNDGVYFRQHGADGDIDLVIRSSVTGSVVENIVHQADWNTDRLDGSNDAFNISGHTLDATKDNIYWIDYQWLGAGDVRFGVNINGVRITCHSWHNANLNNISYMRTGSLPLAIEQENIGTVASTSELRWFCGAVKSEGPFDPHAGQFNFNDDTTLKDIGADIKVPLFSIRPALNYGGKTNKIMIMPSNISVVGLDATGTNEEYYLIELWKNPTLTGATFTNTVSAKSGAEIDTAATVCSGGRRVGSRFVKGVSHNEIIENFNYLHENLVNKQDGTLQHYSVTATVVKSGVAGKLSAALGWKEIRD